MRQTGLEKDQAIIYETLVKSGPQTASKISQKTHYKRGHVYFHLEELITNGLVERIEEPKKVAVFAPLHPVKLKSISENIIRQAQDSYSALKEVLPSIVSDFNLVSKKPGVIYFEGVEGIRKVLWDSLSAKEEIYSYDDPQAIDKYIFQLSKEYRKIRIAKKMHKKFLNSYSDLLRERYLKYPPEITDYTHVRFMDEKLDLQKTLMQIYDDKVSYISLEEKESKGVIIHDHTIYHFHRSLFECNWRQAREL